MQPKSIPDGLVVLTFDDGNRSDVEFVAPMLKDLGFGATFFITEGLNFLADKRLCMTWDEVRGLEAGGFEIGNHSRSHLDARKQSADEFRAEVEHMERRFAEEGIARPVSFCYPGYHFSQQAADVLRRRGYLFARRGRQPEFENDQGVGPAYEPAVDDPLLVPTTFAAGPECTMDDFARAIEQARNGRIAVLTFHGVPDPHPWVQTDPAAFEAYMRRLRSEGCRVIAMRELCDYVSAP
jgi:peptidoglycan/xylan/chitin deacetylase (PgdA/CDA1 family)